MAPSKKVALAVESSKDHSVQEQMAKMITMMEASTQQAAMANRALEEMKEAQAELTTRIAELQPKN